MFRLKRKQHILLAGLVLAILMAFALAFGNSSGLFGTTSEHAPLSGGNEWVEVPSQGGNTWTEVPSEGGNEWLDVPVSGGNNWTLVSYSHVTSPYALAKSLMQLLQQLSVLY